MRAVPRPRIVGPARLSAALAAALAAAPVTAAPGATDMSLRTLSWGPAPHDAPEPPSPAAVDRAAALSAAAQARIDAGDTEGAAELWRAAYASLPAAQGYAPRRAAAALGVAAAEETVYRQRGEVGRLRAALAALDAYLAGLDPTDDENRAAVEQRRGELAALLARVSAPPPAPAAAPPGRRRGIERRAGRSAAGLTGGALLGGALTLGGALAARGATRALVRALARPCEGTDPNAPCTSDAVREALKVDAIADGLAADRLVWSGVVVAGVSLAASATALIVGAVRGRSAVQAGGLGLALRF